MFRQACRWHARRRRTHGDSVVELCQGFEEAASEYLAICENSGEHLMVPMPLKKVLRPPDIDGVR